MSDFGEAVGSAASGAYDASARAARYVSDTTSEHPFSVLVGVAIVAFLGGMLSISGRGDTRNWHKEAQSWRDRGREVGKRARASAHDVSKVADDASDYVYRTVSESPTSSY